MTPQFKRGQIVTFSVVPNASYLSVGTPYRVESVGTREVYFRNTTRDSGTSDTHSMLRFATWEVL
jgi:hypothetical protein